MYSIHITQYVPMYIVYNIHIRLDLVFFLLLNKKLLIKGKIKGPEMSPKTKSIEICEKQGLL